MPNQAIDLQRGLQVWYDFDPRYYDNQRGVLADKSGYGRTAVANGGPTVGVEGPDSFEATGFDGSDDTFTHPNINISDGDEFTLVAKVHPASGEGHGIFNSGRGYTKAGLSLENVSGGLRPLYVTYDSNSTYTGPVIDADVWSTVGLSFRNQKIVMSVSQGDYSETVSFDSADGDDTKLRLEEIGTDAGGQGYINGQMAVAAVWSRGLTIPEFGYLNNLTAPLRSL